MPGGQRGEGGGVAGRVVVGEGHSLPRDQRAEQFGQAVDEADRALGDADAGRALRQGPAPGEPVGQGPLRAEHALGAAGGAGGEHDVRGVVGGQRRARYGGGRLAGVADRLRVEGESPGGLLVAHHEPRVRVPEHEGDALGRVGRVDGHAGGPGLEGGQQRGDEVGSAWQGDGHDGLGPGTAGEQGGGQPVGGGVEPGEGQGRVAVMDGGGPRCVGGLFLEEVADGGVPLARSDSTTPVVRGGMPLARSGSTALVVRGGVQPSHRLVGLLRERPYQPVQPGRDAGHRRVVQGRLLVAEGEGQPVAGEGGEGERVVGGVADRHLGHAGAVGPEGAGDALVVDGIALEDQQGVEEEALPGGPLDAGEPEVLVAEECRLLGLDAPEEVGERLVGA